MPCQNDTARHYSLLSLANNETKKESWERILSYTYTVKISGIVLLTTVTFLWAAPNITYCLCQDSADYCSCGLAAVTRCVLSLLTGLFYYAGHGYEHAGRNYLVAVDAPQPYRPENCVCVQRIMVSMQQRRTALSVILLDTCRKW